MSSGRENYEIDHPEKTHIDTLKHTIDTHQLEDLHWSRISLFAYHFRKILMFPNVFRLISREVVSDRIFEEHTDPLGGMFSRF